MKPYPTILITDDDEDDRHLLQSLLLEADSRLLITTFCNGREVLHYLQQIPDEKLPKLLVLDYQMPVMNALATLRALALEDRFSVLAKAVWSNLPAENIKGCLALGANHCFRKPLSHADGASMVKAMLALLSKQVF